MIILIGGMGYTGKTLISQKLLEKYHYPYLSIDHLKMGLYRSDFNCGFTPLSSQKVIGENLWAILKGIIETNIENGQNLIVEGCYLLPKNVMELENKYPNCIISLYLGFSESYIKKFFDEKIIGNRCVIETRNYENTDTMDDYLLESRNQKKMCEENSSKYFEINNDYEKEINDIFCWIDDEINRRIE